MADRFFDTEEERSKSRVAKLLNEPIPLQLESSFLKGGSKTPGRVRPSLRNDPSMIL